MPSPAGFGPCYITTTFERGVFARSRMFGSNGHYGHRGILNRYAGTEGRKIPGLLQHGWNHDLGATLEDVLLPRPAPFFLWSARNLRECKKLGLSHAVPVGSPFLYLPPLCDGATRAEADAKPDAGARANAEAKAKADAGGTANGGAAAKAGLEEAPRFEPRSLLVMPSHGWEKARIDLEFDQYARDLAAIRRDFGKLTVCLYWFEHRVERHRRRFEELGAIVTTVGPRDGNPRFLYDLRRLLLAHEYVSANRVQTAAFYALALGRKFFFYGPPVGVESRVDRCGKLFDAWQRREFPELAWERFDDTCHRARGEEELGLEFVRTPEELAELFLWTPGLEPAHRARLHEHDARKLERQRRERWAGLRARLERLPLVGRYLAPPAPGDGA